MKKIFSAILCVIMILGCTSVAFATGWGKLEDNDTSCETYNINLYKLERVVGVMGEAFKVVPDATAKIGDIVYFTGYAMGENAINAVFKSGFFIIDEIGPANSNKNIEKTAPSTKNILVTLFIMSLEYSSVYFGRKQA